MRWLVKIALLALYSLITFHLFAPQDRILALMTTVFTFFLGLVSLDREVAINGHGKDPGFLPLFSVLVPIVIALLFWLGPTDSFNDVYKVGFIRAFPVVLKTSRIFMTIFVSAYIVFYIWIPFLLYERIDRLSERWARNTETVA